MRPIPCAAGSQRGAFTRTQALADGWSRSALSHAVRVGDLRLLRPGVYAQPVAASGVSWVDARVDHAVLTAAALLANSGTLASHASAAVLLDLPVLAVPAQPCLTALPGHTGAVSGVHLHRARLFPGDRRRLGALNVIGPERVALDLARESGGEAGLVVADAMLRRGLTDHARLLEGLARCSGWPGSRHARAVVQRADGRAESALESRSRWRLLESDLPEPWPQAEIYVDGWAVGRVDFYWDELGVIGEADGWDKYQIDRDKRRRENRQQEAYERAGAAVVRWGSADLDDFAGVLRRIRAAGADVAGRRRRWVARPTELGRAERRGS